MSFSKYEKHLVECPHCHKEVLDHMTECPFCHGELTPLGYSAAPRTPEQKRLETIVRIIFWVIAAVIVVFLLLKKNVY